MLEDLINQKKKLESEKEYGWFIDGKTFGAAIKDYVFSENAYVLPNITSSVNNEQVATDCENAMKELINLFAKYDIPYENITMVTYPQFYCRQYILDDAKQDIANGRDFHELVLERFKNHILEGIIPVRFMLWPVGMKVPAIYSPDKNDSINVGAFMGQRRSTQCCEEVSNFIKNSSVVGDIEFDKFVKLMKKNGYSIEATDVLSPDFNSYLDGYFQHVENGLLYDFRINADFSRIRR